MASKQIREILGTKDGQSLMQEAMNGQFKTAGQPLNSESKRALQQIRKVIKTKN